MTPHAACRAIVLPLVGVVLAALPVRAASPLAGAWNVTALQPRQDVTLWLVELRQEQDRLEGRVLDALDESKLESVRVVGDELRLAIRMNDVLYQATAVIPANDARPARLLGSLEARGRRDLMRMDRTQAKQLDRGKAVVRGGPALEALEKAAAIEAPRERDAALRNLLRQFGDQPAGVHLAIGMVEMLAEGQAAEADFRASADLAIQYAARHGRGMEMQVAQQCAAELLQARRLPQVALDYAQRAARLLREDDSRESQVRVLNVQARALRQAGKEREAVAIEKRLYDLERELDADALRALLSFKTEPFRERASVNPRVVLVELFTGVHCPPCVAADVAMLALAKSARPDQAVFLQYHLHFPFPDPLTNPDAEKRAAFYEVGGTPFLLINGEWCQRPDDQGMPQGVGGLLPQAAERYRYLHGEIQARMEKPAQARLTLKADRQGKVISVQAEVADLQRRGEDVRLRVALVEDSVRYAGSNGLRLHHQVVRGFLGGAEGIALPNAAAKHALSVDLGQLRQQLLTSLDDYHRIRKFPDAERPLPLENLRVVAFVQDDKTREVLQAAQADLPPGAK